VHNLFILEVFLFSGAALAIGAWELWSTQRAIRKREAEEATQQKGEPQV
jgi:hypothetical protein